MYVLVKKPEVAPPVTIHAPPEVPKQKPEVYFIRYANKENNGVGGNIGPVDGGAPLGSSEEYGGHHGQQLEQQDHLRSQEEFLRSQEEQLRNHEEHLRSQEQLRNHEEHLRSQEQLRDHEEHLRSQEQLRNHEEQFRNHLNNLRAHEEHLRSQEEHLRSHEEQFRSPDEHLRSQEQYGSEEEHLRSQEEQFLSQEEHLGVQEGLKNSHQGNHIRIHGGFVPPQSSLALTVQHEGPIVIPEQGSSGAHRQNSGVGSHGLQTLGHLGNSHSNLPNPGHLAGLQGNSILAQGLQGHIHGNQELLAPHKVLPQIPLNPGHHGSQGLGHLGHPHSSQVPLAHHGSLPQAPLHPGHQEPGILGSPHANPHGHGSIGGHPGNLAPLGHGHSGGQAGILGSLHGKHLGNGQIGGHPVSLREEIIVGHRGIPTLSEGEIHEQSVVGHPRDILGQNMLTNIHHQSIAGHHGDLHGLHLAGNPGGDPNHGPHLTDHPGGNLHGLNLDGHPGGNPHGLNLDGHPGGNSHGPDGPYLDGHPSENLHGFHGPHFAGQPGGNLNHGRFPSKFGGLTGLGLSGLRKLMKFGGFGDRKLLPPPNPSYYNDPRGHPRRQEPLDSASSRSTDYLLDNETSAPVGIDQGPKGIR